MTVRARLTILYSGLLVLIVIGFAVAGYRYLARIEHERIDRTLHEQSEIVTQAIEAIRKDRGAFDERTAAALLPTLHELRARGIRAWIFDDDGKLRLSTGQVEEGEGPDEEEAVLGDSVPFGQLQERAGRRSAMLFEVPAGEYGARLLTTPLAREAGGGMLLVSYPLREVALLLARARWDAAVAILAAVIVSLGAGYVLARGAMAPVAAMSNQAERIGAANLHERVPVHNDHDELGVLATTFNGLLDRVSDTLAQQRRFMADASHELRTPVAILRSETDIVLRTENRTADEYREALAVVQTAAERLGHTVDDIFLLALVDAKEAPLNPRPLYLDDIVTESCRAIRSLAATRAIAIECDASAEAPYVGDEQLLQRLVVNLLDNAIKYSPAQSQIDVRFEREPEAYTLRVSNSGPGIPVEARAQVFDRFFRADTARTMALGENGRITGSGLGLPIARWIAERHGGTLELSESNDRRTTFTLRLPVVPVFDRAH